MTNPKNLRPLRPLQRDGRREARSKRITDILYTLVASRFLGSVSERTMHRRCAADAVQESDRSFTVVVSASSSTCPAPEQVA